MQGVHHQKGLVSIIGLVVIDLCFSALYTNVFVIHCPTTHTPHADQKFLNFSDLS